MKWNNKYFLFIGALATTAAISVRASTHPFPNQVKVETVAHNHVVANHIISTRTTLEYLTQNNVSVLEQYDTFSALLMTVLHEGKGMTDKDIHHILDATSYAAEKHRFQKRKGENQTPYIIHPMGVAASLISIGDVRDADVLIAALLHDVVEDTDTTIEEIYSHFGARVGGFVREVTDDRSLPKERRKQLQIENAPKKSAGAAHIKLADKLYNLTSLSKEAPADWEGARIEAYFAWAKQVVDNLPNVNPALKKAVDEVIENYLNR